MVDTTRSGAEPERTPPDSRLSARFSIQARVSTKPEISLRRELHRRGLRYRVQFKVAGLPRRRVDVAFTKARLAVFVDGCFWHACPEHCVVPKANREWWEWKFAANKARDADTDDRLRKLGWRVVRIWEHESSVDGADRVSCLLSK
ncbi:very short patch repair endonuclease [Terrabacter sp. MAHUQ-38]|uniref:very short patch repair endonuclease n=1 Tax=unclassified Terrabacter TaxID=2630222 RepID=UPI00165D730B|nr:DNA mismatch endonuclease Vsr [Terrabacter sp. MAHUQ-38]